MLPWLARKPCKFLGRHSFSKCWTASASSWSKNAGSIQSEEPASKVILSGIQPTGTPHLGNFLGALSNWRRLQDEATPNDKLFFQIVDYHSLTSDTPSGTVSLGQQTLDMAAWLLAIGINPDRCTVFIQSLVPSHAVLLWILSCLTNMGRLNRMTTWKGKLVETRNANSEDEINESMLNVGLFTYPILQAADVLLYRASHVPVGEDQRQHLEFARDLIVTLNKRMTLEQSLLDTNERPGAHQLVVPKPMISQYKRILSLRDPTQKMSKSAPSPQSRILLTDTYAEIKEKIGKAVTDTESGISYDPISRPGVSNLLTILAGCTDISIEKAVETCGGPGSTKERLKSVVTDAIEERIKEYRARHKVLMDDTGYVVDTYHKGSEYARSIAREEESRITGALRMWYRPP